MNHKLIAESFSRHKFLEVSAYFSDDIVWNVIGREKLTGKDCVIESCETSARYLASVTTRFEKFAVMSGEGWVVVDSTAIYESSDETPSRVASCDIYQFVAGALVEITSFNIELAQPV